MMQPAAACGAALDRGWIMAALALGLFVVLFTWGPSYLGWYDPNGHVALALFATFVFGIICGLKVRT